MAFAVHPVEMPSALNGVENGKIPDELLKNFLSGRLLEIASWAHGAMVEAALADGFVLKETSQFDLYRTYKHQELGFLASYQTIPIPNTNVKEWKGQLWFLKPGHSIKAVPGTSNHGWGLAVDYQIFLTNSAIYKWLVANYDDYGISHEFNNPKAEPWHVRYYAGDRIPAKVREWAIKKGYLKPSKGLDEMEAVVRFEDYANVFGVGPGGWVHLTSSLFGSVYANLPQVFQPKTQKDGQEDVSWRLGLKAACFQNGLNEQTDLIKGGAKDRF